MYLFVWRCWADFSAGHISVVLGDANSRIYLSTKPCNARACLNGCCTITDLREFWHNFYKRFKRSTNSSGVKYCSQLMLNCRCFSVCLKSTMRRCVTFWTLPPIRVACGCANILQKDSMLMDLRLCLLVNTKILKCAWRKEQQTGL